MAMNDPAAGPLANVRNRWLAPDGEPRYARPALLALLALAALVYAWGIGDSPFHSFYADAARSMSQSWKAFFFGSFDPANSITLDKLPGFLWPQALSARLFGFHSWSLTLPQVLEGIGSVWVLYLLVKRWLGVNAALLAGAVFLCIPAADGLFRTQTEDPLFTLCLLLAALATQKAAQTGRLRSLLLAGVWVGAAFQAKMLEAWVVLPALAVVYLVMAPTTLRRRLLHVSAAGVVTLAVSSVWVLAVTLVPAQDRPYVDGTTDNSAFSMVVGYNFLNRFSSVGLSAGGTGSISATQGGHGGHQDRAAADALDPATGGTRLDAGTTGHALGDGGTGAGYPGGPASGEDGWGKMLGSSLASQTGWLYPLSALTVAVGLLWRRREPRTDPVRGGILLWGIWLLSFFLVFSAGAVGGHIYYMGVIAAPSAALAGGGVTMMWRAFRTDRRRSWALPTAVGTTALWGAWIAAQFPGFGTWLAPLVLLFGLAAVVGLVLGRPGRAGRAEPGRAGRVFATAGLVVGLIAILIAPAAWVTQVFAPGGSMSAMMGGVGPSSGAAWSGGRPEAAPGRRGPDDGSRFASAAGGTGQSSAHGGRGAASSGGRGGAFGGGDGRLSSAQQAVLDYTVAHKGSAEYDFATTSWSAASPFILDAGAPVLAMGGFSGQVPFPSQQDFQQLIRSGDLKYVLAGEASGPAAFGGAGGGQMADGSSNPVGQLTQWVTAHCTKVPEEQYAPRTTGGSPTAAQTLYECPSST